MAYIRWIPEVGFELTATAYQEYLEANRLRDRMADHLDDLGSGFRAAADVSESIRRLFLDAHLPGPVADSIRQAYRQLCEHHRRSALDVAVFRSVSEDADAKPGAEEPERLFPRVRGEEALLEACHGCYASLFATPAGGREIDDGADRSMTLWVGARPPPSPVRESAGAPCLPTRASTPPSGRGSARGPERSARS